MRTIYMDYNATTPLDAAVRDAMQPFLEEVWGNPSSVHQVGRRARAFLDEARERTAAVLRCNPAEIIFTAGGTESICLAILGTARALKSKGRHLITSAVEHHAVLHACQYLAAHEAFELSVLPVDSEGFVSPDDLRRALRPDTVLVSIQAANNEIGTLQPVAALGDLCRDKGVVFHTDAVQWFGKEPFEGVAQFHADLVSICSHKFHGPKGAGALYVRSPLKLLSIFPGGSQEHERRAGTENLAAIAGFTYALEQFVPVPVFIPEKLKTLAQLLVKGVEPIPGVRFIGPRTRRLENTVSFVVEGGDNTFLLAGMDLEGICISGGSACSAGSLVPSHVVSALGFEDHLARSLVRFSLGRDSSQADVEFAVSVFKEVVRRVKPSQ